MTSVRTGLLVVWSDSSFCVVRREKKRRLNETRRKERGELLQQHKMEDGKNFICWKRYSM